MTLFIPHYGAIGGAGKYISKLATSMAERTFIQFTGPYRDAYHFDKFPSKKIFDFLLKHSVVPLYSGIGFKARIYYLMKFLLCLIPLIFLLRSYSKKFSTYENFFLTSSIQLPLLMVLSTIFPHRRRIIIIQENICLDGVFGKLAICWLRKSSLIITITKSSQQELNSHGIDSILIINGFDNIDVNEREQIKYDAVYVGGDLKIKGYRQIISLFKLVSKTETIKIAMLGSYSSESVKEIKRLNIDAKNNSKLELIGKVPNCDTYYTQAKFLIIPITSPHFCRPAIEAGLHRKTFIITDLPNLEDFCISETNCINFEHGNLQSLFAAYKRLNNENERKTLEQNNFQFAMEYKSNHSVHLLFDRLGI